MCETDVWNYDSNVVIHGARDLYDRAILSAWNSRPNGWRGSEWRAGFYSAISALSRNAANPDYVRCVSVWRIQRQIDAALVRVKRDMGIVL